jgi:hypothetical protein
MPEDRQVGWDKVITSIGVFLQFRMLPLQKLAGFLRCPVLASIQGASRTARRPLSA